VLVSIIIPAYNAGRFIEETIRSVFKQSYMEWELLICDDGSLPALENQLLFYCKDKRVHYFYKANAGVSDTRNFGLRRTKGDCIVFLDADDVLEVNYLRDRVEVLKQNLDIGYACSTIKVIDEEGNISDDLLVYPVVENVQKEVLIYEAPFADKSSCPSNYMFRRKVCEEVQFNSYISSPADRLFLIEVDFHYKGIVIPEGNNRLLYRIVQGSMSQNKTLAYYYDNERFYEEVMLKRENIDSSLVKQFMFGHGKLLAFGFLKYKKVRRGLRFLWLSFLSNPRYYLQKIKSGT
jgi:glycosyltransferase involved in cell wall biosynthesis